MPPLYWSKAELPSDVKYFTTELQALEGDSRITKELPIFGMKHVIASVLQQFRITGVEGPTGCGKSMGLPEILHSYLRNHVWWHGAIVLVERSVLAAEQVVESLVNHFGWNRQSIHLRTGKHEYDRFDSKYTVLSVITYGILWEWLTSKNNHEGQAAADEGMNRFFQKYSGIILDEFADLDPKENESSSIIKKMIQLPEWKEKRLIVTSAALKKEQVDARFGSDSGFVSVPQRSHTLQRCVVAPMEQKNLLVMAAHLARMAISRSTGNVIVFLPGMAEIIQVKKMLLLVEEGQAYL